MARDVSRFTRLQVRYPNRNRVHEASKEPVQVEILCSQEILHVLEVLFLHSQLHGDVTENDNEMKTVHISAPMLTKQVSAQP